MRHLKALKEINILHGQMKKTALLVKVAISYKTEKMTEGKDYESVKTGYEDCSSSAREENTRFLETQRFYWQDGGLSTAHGFPRHVT